VLISDPFSGSGSISPAEANATAEVAGALDLAGGWHVRTVAQGTEGAGSATPRYVQWYSDDVWHAPDGRLVITNTLPSGQSSTTLYARGERRSYDSTGTLRVHRFVNDEDLRDEVRSLVPPSAADLYRAAYRDGKVRLAGVETLAGRRVYRLAFDWLGSSYTLLFDARRRVPIESEARTPAGTGRFAFSRVRYTAYTRVQPGPSLDRQLVLPAAARGATVVNDRPIVVPAPVRGASAEALVGQLGHSFDDVPGRRLELARATYLLVAKVPGGGVAALARIPNGGRDRSCSATAEFAHSGGEARPVASGCGSGSTSFSLSQTGRAMIIAGSSRGARSVVLRFDGGPSLAAGVKDGMFLAAPAAELLRKHLTMVITNADGSVRQREFPAGALGSGLPPWFGR
jgi:hypothetical protein